MILSSVLLAALTPVPAPDPASPEELFGELRFVPVATQEPAEASGFEFSYTFIELGIGFFDIDDFDENSETLYGRASLGLFDLIYVFLDYQNQSTDFQNTDTDLFGLGAGIHVDASTRLDFVGEASWLTADVSSDLANLDDSNDGWSAFAGARYLALPVRDGGLELNGGFRWIELEGVLSDDQVAAWEAGARYHFGRLFSLGGTYQFLENDGFWGVDMRFSF